MRCCFTLYVVAFIVIPFSNQSLSAQDSLIHPKFSPFQGVVYKMPLERVRGGFGKDVLNMPIVDTVYWDEINFPDSHIEKVPFPGVSLTQAFGIIFTGSVEIPKTAWYKFATKSDDGSILWIDEKKIVDNDKDHRMRLRVDSVALLAGTYPVRLWYYQAYPTRYGVQLAGQYYRDLQPEESIEGPRDSVVLSQDQLLFDHNSSRLPPQGRQVLVELANRLNQQNIRQITITGHTDDTGTAAYNYKLSLDRARAVEASLRAHLKQEEILIQVFGKGESAPVSSNATEDGKAQNRRVVIEMAFY